jgi:hypothetical protein
MHIDAIKYHINRIDLKPLRINDIVAINYEIDFEIDIKALQKYSVIKSRMNVDNYNGLLQYFFELTGGIEQIDWETLSEARELLKTKLRSSFDTEELAPFMTDTVDAFENYLLCYMLTNGNDLKNPFLSLFNWLYFINWCKCYTIAICLDEIKYLIIILLYIICTNL